MANKSSVHVALLPNLIRRDGLDESVVCVVDLLRSSTTMVRAMESGATAIRIMAEPADALRERDQAGNGKALAAGERGGVAPGGFDLGNSPTDFTRERVGGKTIYFTTTNGTKLITGLKGSAALVVGCLQNRKAVAAKMVSHNGPVVIACSGTDGRIALEDCICAGAILDAMLEISPSFEPTDPASTCLWAWRGASRDGASLAQAASASVGAKNLVKLGLGADIQECLRVDVATRVPRWNGEAVVA